MKRLLLLVVLVAMLPSCGVSGLNFVQDDRISITAPKDRAEVTLPLTVRWTAKDFDGTYAVFVDRAPVSGGKDLESLARDDEVCKATPGCPSEQWFADREVFRTSDTTITLDEVPELSRDEQQRVFHEVTIVLLDRAGKRIGESAFSVEFELKRPDR